MKYTKGNRREPTGRVQKIQPLQSKWDKSNRKNKNQKRK